MTLDSQYNPLEIEEDWYQFWSENGYFRADEASDREPYTIVIPPPNVTGSLHMGHALFVTLQDILIRFKRMQGYEALWLPGTDHAGIATQVQVEKMLRDEGTDRHTIGREAFLERVWEWKETYGGRIVDQLKRMGASCDWERERFTMDEGLNRAVREAFVQLYEEGLIYRDLRMVNWDPATHTVLSELEVEREEEPGKFWYLRYPLADGSGHLVVGTTRPETMLGDTAVAVHPDDERYADMIGKMVDLPLCDRQIPIVADTELPDPEKGTGAVKVTPAHDPNDFACGQRHDLETIQVIGLDATMNEHCPDDFVGLDRYEARQLVVRRFEELELLEGIDEITYSPGRSERSGVVVEPLPMMQWFVEMEPLARPAIDAVESGRTEIIPAVWKKTYDHFMYNIRDWCISRQLWWGHRIPAWFCEACDHITVARQDPEACEECGSDEIHQDPDVLDTWFSSGLWPFSTLGWPDETPSLEKFYPTQVMETGYDILFFWVARMMVMGLHFMEEEPFSKVYLHAMVRDMEGNKMSKTRGNVIDPVHMIEGADPGDFDPELHRELMKQYPDGVEAQGADALRFTLAIYEVQGRNINLDVSRMEGYRAFLNKLWNAAKFGLMHLEDHEPADYATHHDPAAPAPALTEDLSLADRWIVTRIDEVVEEVTAALEDYKFNEVTDTLYHFVWHEFCDWYIEAIKSVLYSDGEELAASREATRATLLYALETILRLMHPITPHVTEHIWHALPRADDAPEALIVAPWPSAGEAFARDEEARASFDLTRDVISKVRAIRGNSNVNPGVTIDRMDLSVEDASQRERLERGLDYVRELAGVEAIRFVDADAIEEEATATAVVEGITITIPLAGLIDVAEERARLERELERVAEDLDHVDGKLSNENFVERAPEHIVQKERDKKAAYLEERAALQKSLEELEKLA
jgi:valyl-tRNA synthetase